MAQEGCKMCGIHCIQVFPTLLSGKCFQMTCLFIINGRTLKKVLSGLWFKSLLVMTSTSHQILSSRCSVHLIFPLLHLYLRRLCMHLPCSRDYEKRSEPLKETNPAISEARTEGFMLVLQMMNP